MSMEEINEVDLAEVIDTTGSMGNFISAAKRHLVSVLTSLSQAADINLRVGLVEYRDHPPQDTTLTRVYPFTAGLPRMQAHITALEASGGGDSPEAVYDGIADACRKLEWRKHARRLLVLVGDAPPHGTGFPDDRFPHGCPCGETIESIAALCEESGVTLYALGLTPHVEASFKKLATMTGGAYYSASHVGTAIEQMVKLLAVEFANLELDRKVYAAAQENADVSIETLAEQLGQPRATISASWVRLCSRGLLKEPVRS